MAKIQSMRRFASSILTQWQNKKARMPLIIRGARQVGKTWLVREHAQSYSSFVELNLEAHPEYHAVFADFFGKPKALIEALSLMIGKKIESGKTLLFLDEVQECESAILALRYFKEELPELHIIAAGSLLEFVLKKLSFPVGRVEFLYLFPMNFEEYLQALPEGESLRNAISSSNPDNPLPTVIHERLLEEAQKYTLLGGMPQVLKTYFEEKDWNAVQEIQQILITSFRSDFHKYASLATVEHIKKIFDSVPRLLSQKFKYSQVSKDTKSRELSKALYLLEEAGLVYKVHHSSSNGCPLSAEADLEKFKVFFLDIGLCLRVLGLSLSQLFLERKTLFVNRGALAEQFVAQELFSLTPKNFQPELFYWHREAKSSQAEVDFVIERNGEVIPVEVKSQNKGSMASLHLFMKEKKSKLGIKISSFPISSQLLENQKLESLPFYQISSGLKTNP